ncbi:MAG: SO_0444 family Cu/Zn efflux transporter [Phycisphaerae bacterium]|nr:SO_0444 family Cu/Zn efflux transporter [Phycisphaerae bacterium]
MPQWLVDIPVNLWSVLTEMAPYLLFGFLVAGVLSVVISEAFIRRHLGGRGVWQVVKAAVVGVPMPLCSCGVIPVSSSLRRRGASKGATVGFLIATPQDGVDSILVTFSLLGPVYAVFRPVVALVSGILGGVIVSGASPEDDQDNNTAVADDDAAQNDAPDPMAAASSRGKLLRALGYGFGELPRDIGKALLVGLLLAALISAAVPEGYLAGVLGGGILAMLVMMLVGVPVYVCATASVPVAAALIAKGASPGAALVFLMTGPATNAATLVTIWRVLGRKTAVIYLLTVAGSALGAGLLLDAIFEIGHIPPPDRAGFMLPTAFKTAAAIALLGVLGWALVAPYVRRKRGAAAPRDAALELGIQGMTCSHCVATVREALLGCEGVTDADVDLRRGAATVAGNADADALRDTVEQAGYTVTDVYAPSDGLSDYGTPE